MRTSGKKAMHEQLMEEMVKPENVELALAAVERNKGAGGIDRMTTKELRKHLEAYWGGIRTKLLEGKYVPSPVRRKEIAKPDGGIRLLGIPTVLDRFIQQLLLQVMTLIYEPMFSEHSYGFRPGRSTHDAVRAAQRHAREGKQWVVDMDISKFFDCVNHDILMGKIGQSIRDKRVLKLIGKYLRAGVMVEGVVVMSEEGTPQGGPLSPLLANIYLDALDKELKRRGHAFCRYADDCNIYVSSQASAERVLQSISQWITDKLRLEINAKKSGTGEIWGRGFLGFSLNRKLEIEVAEKNLKRFKDKVRELWKSCQSLTSEELRDNWRAYVQGWWGYFRLAENRRTVFGMEGWIRRHIRRCFWQRWHDGKGRERKLQKLGLKGRLLKPVRSSVGAWTMARSGSVQTALNNRVLRQYGFLMPSDLAG
jgi:RNA-directed DNA polymerase